jgi:uncharacterized protein (DUF58 family)
VRAFSRLFRPPRTIRPTRDGWWMLFAAVGLGVAAINTGNNLLYLLCSLLLALVIVSGILSEQTMRGVRVESLLAEEMFARRPVVVGASVVNGKQWLTSYSVVVEVLDPGGLASYHLPRLPAGARRLVTWQCAMPERGRHRLPGVRIATRFPFGLFSKVSRVLLDPEVIVFPAIRPAGALRLRDAGGAAGATTHRRGRGHELHSLREYRPGDDHRLIHWRSTARVQVLTVREFETDTTLDTRIRLVGDGAAGPERLERGVSDAASLAVHLLRMGGAVEVTGSGIFVPAARGRDQERRVLTALALYQPCPGAESERMDRDSGRLLREVRVDLG